MAEAIADRLAEAFAEVLHGITRKELWAYAPDEDLSAQDMLRVKYQGALLMLLREPAMSHPTSWKQAGTIGGLFLPCQPQCPKGQAEKRLVVAMLATICTAGHVAQSCGHRPNCRHGLPSHPAGHSAVLHHHWQAAIWQASVLELAAGYRLTFCACCKLLQQCVAL